MNGTILCSKVFWWMKLSLLARLATFRYRKSSQGAFVFITKILMVCFFAYII